MGDEQFSLSWNNFHSNLSSGFNSLYQSEDLVDVTLAAEGRYLKAHKIVLSVCSEYFKELFQVNPCKHPIVILKDVSYSALRDLLQFMYQGEVSVSQDELGSLMKVAETLQIKGLTEDHLENQNGVRGIHVVDVKNLSDPRATLKRPKIHKRIKQMVPVKIPKLSPDNAAETEPIVKSCMEPPDVSMLVESELVEQPVKPKLEPEDDRNDSLDYSQQSYSDLDMSGMLDTSLGESSQGSGSWKTEMMKVRPNEVNNAPGIYMFTRSRKGMPHLVLDSNLFRPSGRVGTKLKNHKYWECVQNRKTGCRARCMYYNGEIFLKCRDHNHVSPTDYIKQRERIGALYYMCLDSDIEGMFQQQNEFNLH